MYTFEEPAVLANAVTGFAIAVSGLLVLLLTYLVAPQPLRWRLAYFSIFVTGIPTVWYHGFGEHFFPRVADVGSNYIVGCLLVAAILGDYYPRRSQWLLLTPLIVLNILALVNMIHAGAPIPQSVSVGSRGFTIWQLTLVLDSVLTTVIFYLNWKKLSAKARTLLYIQSVWFLLGAWCAAANPHRVDLQVISYHALWHLVAAFGFVILWALNHVRFSSDLAQTDSGLSPSTIAS